MKPSERFRELYSKHLESTVLSWGGYAKVDARQYAQAEVLAVHRASMDLFNELGARLDALEGKAAL
jgi:hypothetical protein